VQSKIQRVAAEDVAHVVAADDDHLQFDFFRDCLQARRAHLTRRSDREPIAGNHEGFAAMDACAEVGHEVPERSGLPPLIERLEALGHAIGRRRDLIGVDGVELLLLSWNLEVPENERLAAHDRARLLHLVG